MRYLASVAILLFAGCASGHSQAQGDDDSVPIDANLDVPDAEPHNQDIDAMPITSIDASPGAPDAAVPPDADIPPDATPACTPITQQKLTNAGFDGTPLGNGWTEVPQDPTYPPIVTPTDLSAVGVTAQSPQNAVWLGGLLSSHDYLYQDVTLPADATTLQISFYKWFASEETTTGHDSFTVSIRNTSNVLLSTVYTSNDTTTTTSDTTWALQGPLAVTGSYAGQTIRIELESQTDAANNSNFFVDTTSFTILACP